MSLAYVPKFVFVWYLFNRYSTALLPEEPGLFDHVMPLNGSSSTDFMIRLMFIEHVRTVYLISVRRCVKGESLI